MPVTARFASDPFSVVEARQLVEAALGGCPPTAVEDVALLTSELVSNAVRHAGTPFEVLVDRKADRVRVTVVDESAEPPTLLRPGPDDVGGRGLVLVSRLADRWGFESRRLGKAIWFEVRV